jgi:DNA-binding CsgD family transcriptional regulator
VFDSNELRSSPACIQIGTVAQPVIVVDRRLIIARSLCCWMGTLGPEFDPVSMATVDLDVGQELLGRASAVVWGSTAQIPWEDEWLFKEIASTRVRRFEIPLVLVADAADPNLAEEAVRRLHLSGYIPTASSPELAATALRLVIFGGRYIPGRCSDAGAAAPAVTRQPPTSAYDSKLTTRERAVLELLERGLPNKVIAVRLGMSPSTVKAHVHNIIAKLNVRNRTEAAVARYSE